MPVLNLAELMPRVTSSYPAPFDKACKGRRTLRLSDAGGLNQFGANLVTLAPKAWASQRHHHSAEDELVYIISGHPTLVDDNGEQRLSPGDVCTHAAGDGNGHHLVNNTETDAVFLVIGTRNSENDHCKYPDIDLDLPANGTAQRVFGGK